MFPMYLKMILWLTAENEYVQKVREFAAAEGAEVIVVCAKIEEEMAALEDDEKDDVP